MSETSAFEACPPHSQNQIAARNNTKITALARPRPNCAADGRAVSRHGSSICHATAKCGLVVFATIGSPSFYHRGKGRPCAHLVPMRCRNAHHRRGRRAHDGGFPLRQTTLVSALAIAQVHWTSRCENDGRSFRIGTRHRRHNDGRLCRLSARARDASRSPFNRQGVKTAAVVSAAAVQQKTEACQTAGTRSSVRPQAA
jgi:hypothetical protein